MFDDNAKQKEPKTPIRVLFFVDRLLRGGIQTFIWNTICFMPKEKVQIDILILDDGKHYDLEDELKHKGVRIYQLKGVWPNTVIGFLRFLKSSDDFFRTHQSYDIVHIHSSSKAFPIAKAARKYGIKNVIAHSHNIGFQTQSRIKAFIGDIFKRPFINYCNYYVACSKDAGTWLFGKKIVSGKRFTVIPNGIDFSRYRYNEKMREKIRAQYHIENQFVVGNVARLNPQKNHSFLLAVFYEIKRIHNNSILLLVGDGPLKMDLEKKAKEYGIEDSVIFAGFHENTSDYLNAMDCFVFPSLYEGLGIVLIEAQANGLLCYASDVVPIESNISQKVRYISLQKTASEWADIIFKGKKNLRTDINFLQESEYDIHKTVSNLEFCYKKILKYK